MIDPATFNALRAFRAGVYRRFGARRAPPTGTAHAVAAAQIRDLVARQPPGGPAPLCVFDAGYDPETLARELGERDGERVAILVRLRSGRCFYADPPQAGPQRGRP